jgi:secondary thiamine-phosphate synthase enzyme
MVRHSTELSVNTSDKTDIVDLTDKVADCLKQSGISSGLATVFVPGSTGAVTTIEYESGVLNDLTRAIERLAPENEEYQHDRRWGDGNGYAHVRAALLGPSMTIPVIDGQLTLGTWQQVVLLDFDNRPRKRRILIHIIGETSN